MLLGYNAVYVYSTKPKSSNCFHDAFPSYSIAKSNQIISMFRSMHSYFGPSHCERYHPLPFHNHHLPNKERTKTSKQKSNQKTSSQSKHPHIPLHQFLSSPHSRVVCCRARPRWRACKQTMCREQERPMGLVSFRKRKCSRRLRVQAKDRPRRWCSDIDKVGTAFKKFGKSLRICLIGYRGSTMPA